MAVLTPRVRWGSREVDWTWVPDSSAEIASTARRLFAEGFGVLGFTFVGRSALALHRARGIRNLGPSFPPYLRRPPEPGRNAGDGGEPAHAAVHRPPLRRRAGRRRHLRRAAPQPDLRRHPGQRVESRRPQLPSQPGLLD